MLIATGVSLLLAFLNGQSWEIDVCILTQVYKHMDLFLYLSVNICVYIFIIINLYFCINISSIIIALPLLS